MGGGPQFPYGPPPGPGGAPPPPKKGMSAAAIVLIIFVALLVVGGGGCMACWCYGSNKLSEANEQDDLDRRRARNVSISELLTTYRTNEVRADNQYKGKWITVQGGQVDEVRSSYILVGTGKYLEIPEVQCLLKSDQTSKAASLSKGRRVTVRGKVTGMLVNVMLNECEIL
jgi:hypothetical protein